METKKVKKVSKVLILITDLELKIVPKGSNPITYTESLLITGEFNFMGNISSGTQYTYLGHDDYYQIVCDWLLYKSRDQKISNLLL